MRSPRRRQTVVPPVRDHGFRLDRRGEDDAARLDRCLAAGGVPRPVRGTSASGAPYPTDGRGTVWNILPSSSGVSAPGPTPLLDDAIRHGRSDLARVLLDRAWVPVPINDIGAKAALNRIAGGWRADGIDDPTCALLLVDRHGPRAVARALAVAGCPQAVVAVVRSHPDIGVCEDAVVGALAADRDMGAVAEAVAAVRRDGSGFPDARSFADAVLRGHPGTVDAAIRTAPMDLLTGDPLADGWIPPLWDRIIPAMPSVHGSASVDAAAAALGRRGLPPPASVAGTPSPLAAAAAGHAGLADRLIAAGVDPMGPVDAVPPPGMSRVLDAWAADPTPTLRVAARGWIRRLGGRPAPMPAMDRTPETMALAAKHANEPWGLDILAAMGSA